jgi:hypothetical protein
MFGEPDSPAPQISSPSVYSCSKHLKKVPESATQKTTQHSTETLISIALAHAESVRSRVCPFAMQSGTLVPFLVFGFSVFGCARNQRGSFGFRGFIRDAGHEFAAARSPNNHLRLRHLAISHYFSFAPRKRAGQLGFQAENCEPGGTETRWNSAKKVLLSATQKHVDISPRRVVAWCSADHEAPC